MPHQVLERRALVVDRQQREPVGHPGAHPGAELRQRHHHRRPRPVLHREPVALAERALQPAVDVAQPDAGAAAGERLGGALGVDPLAVVGHAQLDVGAEVAPLDRHAPALGPRLDAVADGVLDERLQRQHRHDRVQHLGVDLDAHAQPLAEARLLEPQVLLHVLQLVGERHVRALAGERVADELGELDQQLARLLRPRVDEGGDGGERVVDEVRRDLRAQRPQLGAGEPLALRLELGQLDHRRDERGRLGHDARLLQPQPSRPLVERDERADPCPAHGERRDDRRAQRAARRRRRRAAARRARAPRAARGRARRARRRRGGGRRPRRRTRAARRRRRARRRPRRSARAAARPPSSRSRRVSPLAQVGQDRGRGVHRALHRRAARIEHARRPDQPPAGRQRRGQHHPQHDPQGDVHAQLLPRRRA